MPTIRGSAIASSSAATFAVAWPAGTVAGDTALIFLGGGFGFTLPAGWTSLSALTGSNWNGAVFSKVLVAADITAGSVSVKAAGTFNAVRAIVTIQGAPFIRDPADLRNGAGATSVVLASNDRVFNGDLVLLFGSNRAASADTINQGAVVRSINAANASGALYSKTVTADGSFSATFAYPTAGTGNYQAIIALGDDEHQSTRATQAELIVVETPETAARSTQISNLVIEQPDPAPARSTQISPLVIEQLRSLTHARSTNMCVLILEKLGEDTLIDYQDRAIRRARGAGDPERFIDLPAPADLVEYPCQATPRFSDRMTNADSGDTLVKARWADPLMRFTLPDAIRDQATLEAVRDHWLIMRGPAHTWPFANPLDFASSRLSDDHRASIGSSDQVIGAGNGRTTRFQLIKSYTRGSQTYFRPIVLPRPETVRISIEGDDLGHQYWSIGRRGGVIEFTSAPELGAIIRAGFLFDHEVRYDGDDGFQAVQNSFAASGYAAITLVEVRGTRNG